MNINISGKRVLITASTEGIGRGVAEAFLREGCNVVISSRSEQKLNKALADLRQISPSIWGFISDLTVESTLEELVMKAVEVMKGIDVLVVNSGNPPKEPSFFFENSMQDWEYSIRLYLLSAIKLVNLVYPYMREQRWGRIFFLSSWTVKEPQRLFSLADITRAPLIQMAKLLSRELSQFNITTNVILMGSFDTEGARRSLKKYAEKVGQPVEVVWEKEVLSQIPLRRSGDIKNELGSLLIYLSSDYGSYVNGSYILIDGGITRSV
ncbi:3-oxoacyl-ACP reductase [Sulfolobus sp. A20]|uniref:SDR family oxidoreductase n=1 Tax=Sulfolobaceae TaxID=118883 RepID=UPI0008461598|nr:MULTISPECIES: SDR family oxidoreductase [unclassified Sulfolobus]TRM78146.1 SDR family NAD(P)-dependent oxidoreductase [Sulfolobus sp. A20-N-F8]TRM81509.1 SDR family NAD(P)-dependent oxidoreductase [Sulfolobus sp. D5]TRM84167.1 SDR family NAD(P)-dependent oxidoreductase [Sulfolobus sp. A20-N-F6]TRM88660.1 SDR family NAD(P)-dependent oxidoreductase [Sulfolobus sp. C3]TRM97937.1 SDR family NAD(P)-dependent oxidoreductase [Sulfolobus sp. E1]TRM98696.1 SDR family NAD(P)-dependent oxidoreductas